MWELVKNFFVTLLIGSLVFVIGSYMFTGFDFKSVNNFLIYFGIYQLYTFSLNFVNSVFFDFMKKKTYQRYDILQRIVYGILGSTIISLITIFILRVIVEVFIFDEPFEIFIANESWGGYWFGLLITLVIVSIFYGIYFYNRYQKNKIKEQKVIAGAASAKFDALKNQLDPHFLFNSLNVLTSLIEENPKAAQKFTTSLSKVYRYVLEQKSKELVTVDEELDFAKTYMTLLKMRFEDSIIFEMPERASNPESKVVPLSLQLLLENAVKHNMVTSSKPLHIKIYEDGEHLVVMNNLQPKQIVKKSSGVGLENIKQRYALLSKRQVHINQRAQDFAVAIPMLTKQVNIMRTLAQPQAQLNDHYVRARKRVEELKGLYYSLMAYCVIIPFLIFIYFKFSSHTIQWFWFPMAGWGLSLLFQAYRVFVDNGPLGDGWEKRKIEEYMQKENQNNRWN